MLIVALLLCAGIPQLTAQRLPDAKTSRQQVGSFWQRDVPHYGKWLTVLSGAALIVFAEREHDRSRRDWNSLLDICRSAPDACGLGSDGRYIRADAERLFQRSRSFDRRANRWLFGAQASLLATTALFIIDLHPGEGPGNIPYPPVKLGMRISF